MVKPLREQATAFRIRIGALSITEPGRVIFQNEFFDDISVKGSLRVWTGSAWVDRPVKTWTGLSWVIKPIKSWNGTTWVLS